jgi:uncharacterized protein YajQ (UPF0234 family)
MRKYSFSGNVSFDVEIEVEASSVEEAEEKAKKEIINTYDLHVYGMYHNPKYFDVDLTENDYEDA